ncbi:unnamed protein product [Psylliodes chrysocephalus]|uniref:FAM192A/Fyv6 N-terminal domain-containing protein n=1 Tax=Psylliodes chrysocephalus TaxID=3402493 RepID=A0A9P0GF85_9CUCU|nr:unnamed protein product [Psylliodes chrysocephala]
MSSGFITESEAAEIRKRRQEEWETVRNADDPLVKPEEPYDNRSLFEKLQEQKQKKDLEYEEAHKLKNMIKGLDDDEIEFLDLVDRKKTEADRRKELEEEQELLDYRNRVSILQEKSMDERLQAEIVVNKVKKDKQPNMQQKLMKGVVIKRPESQKRKISESGDDSIEVTKKKLSIEVDTGLKCIAVLPGIGCYEASSSDEDSSESDIDCKPLNKIDLLGRKLEKKEETSQH